MRFTHSIVSFRAGRLSPRLNNRVDTTQYRDGMSELKNMRPLVGGGATRPKGTTRMDFLATAHMNGDLISTPTYLVTEQVKMFDIEIDGVWCCLILALDKYTGSGNDNRVLLYIYTYNYSGALDVVLPVTSERVNYIEIVPSGMHEYPIEGFSISSSGKEIIICHDSGQLNPAIFSFTFDHSQEGSPLEANLGVLYNFVQGKVATYSLNGHTFWSQGNSGVWPRKFPFKDLRDRGRITLGTYVPASRKIDITFYSEADYLEALGSAVLYAEGIGARVFETGSGEQGFNFPVSNYFFLTGDAPVIGTGTWKLNYIAHYTVTTAGVTNESMKWANIINPTLWATSAWREGEYPKYVTHNESRTVFGGTYSQPMTIFGSDLNATTRNAKFGQIKSPDSGIPYYTVRGADTGDTNVSDPFVFTIKGGEDHRITNMISGAMLFVGTDRGEYFVHGGDQMLSALSVNVSSQSSYGSITNRVTTNGKNVYLVSNNGKGIIKTRYNPENGSTMSTRLDVLIDDLIDDSLIKRIEWVPHVDTLYILLESGKLLGIVDNEQAEVTAPFETGHERVLAITKMGSTPKDIIPLSTKYLHSRNNIGDHIAMIKGHNIVGSLLLYEPSILDTIYKKHEVGLKRAEFNEPMYLEGAFMERIVFHEEIDIPTGEFVLTGISSHGGGFEPIARKRMYIVVISRSQFRTGDVLTFYVPKDMGNFDISNQQDFEVFEHELKDTDFVAADRGYRIPTPEWFFDLPRNDGFHGTPYSDATGFIDIIIAKKSDVIPVEICTLPIEAGQQWGTAQMGIKNIDKIGLRTYKTYSLEVSSGEGTPEIWDEVVFTDDEGNLVKTARRELNFSSSPKYDQIVKLRNTKPEPCTVIGINLRGVSNDG